jgi:hypothetical protein
VENSKNFAAPAPKRKKIRPLAVAAPQHWNQVSISILPERIFPECLYNFKTFL